MSYNEARRIGTRFPSGLREALEQICSGSEITLACGEHQRSPGTSSLDAFVASELARHRYPSERNVRVTSDSKFDIDLLVTQSDWRVAISVQGGKAARIDLDLLKFIALGRTSTWPGSMYAAFVVSDKRLPRSITGSGEERAFDYALRLGRLFHASEPNVADLLVVEFSSDS